MTENASFWTPFWKNKSVTSFGNLFPENYDGEILSFWRRELTGCSGHIVDLACGNGALTWICDSIVNRESNRSRVTGIDFADIRPFDILETEKSAHPMVSFIANTPIENLPFPDTSIDVFVSQYGAEYSNLHKTIPEIGRALVPDGKVCFILHDLQSTLVKGASEHLEELRTAAFDICMHELAFDLAELIDRIGDKTAQQGSIAFQQLMSRIQARAAEVNALTASQQPNSPLALYVRRLNQAFADNVTKSLAERKHEIAVARDSLVSHIRRIDELRDAALKPDKQQQMETLLMQQGLIIESIEPLYYGNHGQIGKTLVAGRG